MPLDFDGKGNLRKSRCKDGCQKHQIHRLHLGTYYPEDKFPEKHQNDPLTQKIMKTKKVGGEKYADYICDKLYKRVLKKFQNMLDEAECIVPVPLHEQHTETCSQKLEFPNNLEHPLDEPHTKAPLLAETLAKIIHDETGREIPVYKNVLVRDNYTKPTEHNSTSPERFSYARQDYHFGGVDEQQNIDDKHILLIDDIMASKATITVCAELLCKHGANQVTILCASESRLR